MKYRKTAILTVAALSLLWACGGTAETSAPGGQTAADIFASKCSMCHDFKEDRTGPALGGVYQRWGSDTVKLKAFIRNAQEMINKGDPYSVALYNKWNKAVMPAFPGISEAELEALVAYLK